MCRAIESLIDLPMKEFDEVNDVTVDASVAHERIISCFIFIVELSRMIANTLRRFGSVQRLEICKFRSQSSCGVICGWWHKHG